MMWGWKKNQELNVFQQTGTHWVVLLLKIFSFLAFSHSQLLLCKLNTSEREINIIQKAKLNDSYFPDAQVGYRH